MQLCMTLYETYYVRNPHAMSHYGQIYAIKDSYFNVMFDKESIKYKFKDKYHLTSMLVNTESYNCD